MITNDKMCRKFYAIWIGELRKKKDPDFELKKQTIIEIMNELGVEEMENFEAEIEDVWKRHFCYVQKVPWYESY